MPQGVRSRRSGIQLPRVDGKSCMTFFSRCGWITRKYSPGWSIWKYYPDSPNLIFVPNICLKRKIKEHQIVDIAGGKPHGRRALEWEKEKYVHDFICENVRYDKLKKPYSHEIIGPLGQGVGVCEGIAKAVKVFCDALGLWCMIAICGNNPEKKASNTAINLEYRAHRRAVLVIWMRHLTIV